MDTPGAEAEGVVGASHVVPVDGRISENGVLLLDGDIG